MAQLSGVFRLGRDAEVKFIPSGEAVASLALAFNYGKKDDQGNRSSQWIEAALWGKRAEALAPYLKKGGQVYVLMTEPHIETYQKNDGGQGFKLVARVLDVELIGGQNQNGQQPQRSPQAAAPQRNAYADAKGASQPAAQQRQPASGDFDDDIPF